jgi:hypothetical protein
MTPLSALDQFLDPSGGWLTPQIAQRIVSWRPSDEARDRILELGRKAEDGTLTPDEDAEYERYIEEGDVIALLQAKTRRLLEHPGE